MGEARLRISSDQGVPRASITLGHFVEQCPCIAERGTFGVRLDGAVDEEDGCIGGEGEQVILDPSGCNDGFGGGTEAEEVRIERVWEGSCEVEEGVSGLLDATLFQVLEDCFGHCLGAGCGGGGGSGRDTWVWI